MGHPLTHRDLGPTPVGSNRLARTSALTARAIPQKVTPISREGATQGPTEASSPLRRYSRVVRLVRRCQGGCPAESINPGRKACLCLLPYLRSVRQPITTLTSLGLGALCVVDEEDALPIWRHVVLRAPVSGSDERHGQRDGPAEEPAARRSCPRSRCRRGAGRGGADDHRCAQRRSPGPSRTVPTASWCSGRGDTPATGHSARRPDDAKRRGPTGRRRHR
jgi:hypothetical protein